MGFFNFATPRIKKLGAISALPEGGATIRDGAIGGNFFYVAGSSTAMSRFNRDMVGVRLALPAAPYVLFHGNGRLFMGSNGSHGWISDDDGETWTQKIAGSTAFWRQGAVSDSGNVIFQTNSTSLFRVSTDNGDTFTSLTSPVSISTPPVGVNKAVAWIRETNRFFFMGNTASVIHWSDDLVNFTSVNTGTPGVIFAGIVFFNNEYYLATRSDTVNGRTTLYRANLSLTSFVPVASYMDSRNTPGWGANNLTVYDGGIMITGSANGTISMVGRWEGDTIEPVATVEGTASSEFCGNMCEVFNGNFYTNLGDRLVTDYDPYN